MDTPIKPPLTGHVFNIQKFTIYDGSGTRTIAFVFLKGCPLKYAWCSNPKGTTPSSEVLYKESACINYSACEATLPELPFPTRVLQH